MYLNYSARLDIFCIRKLEELKRLANIESYLLLFILYTTSVTMTSKLHVAQNCK